MLRRESLTLTKGGFRYVIAMPAHVRCTDLQTGVTAEASGTCWRRAMQAARERVAEIMQGERLTR